jgi:hypothetical protein
MIIEGARPAASRGFPIASLTLVGACSLAAVGVAGWSYYTAPLGERMRSDLHAWLRPSGYVGQSAGIIAFLCFVFIWLYPLRKRFAHLPLGSLRRWLDLHVVAGLLMPLLVATHAAWRFTGLIGLGYAAIVMVCVSGVIGRYLYVRIPRSRSGLEMTLDEVRAEQNDVIAAIAMETRLGEGSIREALEAPPLARGAGILSVFRQMVADDIARRDAPKRLRDALRRAAPGVAPNPDATRRAVRLARRQMALGQQARMLEATQQVFRFWHAAHKPVAFTALIAVLIHVVVVVAMGATWFL